MRDGTIKPFTLAPSRVVKDRFCLPNLSHGLKWKEITLNSDPNAAPFKL
jgi:hypothetical protein